MPIPTGFSEINSVGKSKYLLEISSIDRNYGLCYWVQWLLVAIEYYITVVLPMFFLSNFSWILRRLVNIFPNPPTGGMSS